ncbi:MAG: LacI family DNA-binding transcriptional regulator [Candidatus Merdousia sp.]|nr:LacI family DNA-binding transcriptional regulator [Candidatus Merdousia sp.]
METKKTTLADIAKKLKISKSAVSLALKDSPMVSKRTRDRVAKAARSMGYVRNELVSSMMSSMKKNAYGVFSESVALINGNIDEYALTNHPTLPKYYVGIKEEAKRLGYSINEFWLHDPRLNAEILAKTFRSRGIRGGVIIGHSADNVFPAEYESIWRDFYFISVGIQTFNPTLEMVSADQYAVAYGATKKAVELGYKRPALVIEKHIDEIVGGRFVGGFLRAQFDLPAADRIAPFTYSDTLSGYVNKLYSWLDKRKPDVVLYLLDSTREIIADKPRNGGCIPLIQLERRGYVPEWTGMEQNNDLVGRVALRRLCDMLNRNPARGGEASNLLTLVPPTWIGSSSDLEQKM